MIPEFPTFKKLELSDKKFVEQIVCKYPLNSDFHFVSLWAWDTKGEVEISRMHENLIVRFTDYLSGEPFFSFLGDNRLEETIDSLVNLSKEKYGKNYLRYISENLVQKINNHPIFEISDDSASHDYVYEVAHLANMHQWSKHSSGKNIRSFVKEFSDYKVKLFDLNNAPVEDCMNLFKKWTENRELINSEVNEFKAAERIFYSDIENLKVVTLYHEDRILGFTVYEIIEPGYAVSHFAKADKTYHKAVGDILNWEEAKILLKYGVKYFNWEEDLGIEGLRKFKEKYKPAYLLKKYKVSKK